MDQTVHECYRCLEGVPTRRLDAVGTWPLCRSAGIRGAQTYDAADDLYTDCCPALSATSAAIGAAYVAYASATVFHDYASTASTAHDAAFDAAEAVRDATVYNSVKGTHAYITAYNAEARSRVLARVLAKCAEIVRRFYPMPFKES